MLKVGLFKLVIIFFIGNLNPITGMILLQNGAGIIREEQREFSGEFVLFPTKIIDTAEK